MWLWPYPWHYQWFLFEEFDMNTQTHLFPRSVLFLHTVCLVSVICDLWLSWSTCPWYFLSLQGDPKWTLWISHYIVCACVSGTVSPLLHTSRRFLTSSPTCRNGHRVFISNPHQQTLQVSPEVSNFRQHCVGVFAHYWEPPKCGGKSWQSVMYFSNREHGVIHSY